MLVTLRRNGEERVSDAVDMLLACHVRIRAFTDTAGRLGRVLDVAPAEVGDAAARVHRYYTVALPLHAEDEDRSVAPRLRAVALPHGVEEALTAMTHQHLGIEEATAAVAPLWLAVAAEPGRQPELRAELARHAALLERLWEVHLGIEERVIFPAVRARVDREELAAVAAEMRTRREGRWQPV